MTVPPSTTLGNPAPLGLLAFGMTTAMLMYVEMGWAEVEFEAWVYGVAMFFGGVCQLVVAILELFRGSSFSFAVFGSYGAFWLGWAVSYAEMHRVDSELSNYSSSSMSNGKTAMFIQWGVLSLCFFVITLRKNVCLVVTFALLCSTFFLLAAANSTLNEHVKMAAGYVGFFTAISAWYTGFAELVNEEYGRHLLPGLMPLLTPERVQITMASIQKRISYDSKTNTLLLHFLGLHIQKVEDVRVIYQAVEKAVKEANNALDNKVHVIVNYKDVQINNDVVETYWAAVHELQSRFYLSVKRFHVTSFGTTTNGSNIPTGPNSVLAYSTRPGSSTVETLFPADIGTRMKGARTGKATEEKPWDGPPDDCNV